MFIFARNSIPMKSQLIVLVLFAALASCNKYESQNADVDPNPFYVPTYQIGDYYLNDTLQGIVFATISGGTNGLMVSLEEVQLPWCIPNYVNTETGVTNPYDGWYNTNGLLANYDLNHFPTIQWSHQRNTWRLVYQPHFQIMPKQWYVPSSTELRYLLQNQDAVNRTLDSLGLPTLEDKTYWTSTETGTRCAAAGRLQDGQIVIGDSVKDRELYVRAIKNF